MFDRIPCYIAPDSSFSAKEVESSRIEAQCSQGSRILISGGFRGIELNRRRCYVLFVHLYLHSASLQESRFEGLEASFGKLEGS